MPIHICGGGVARTTFENVLSLLTIQTELTLLLLIHPAGPFIGLSKPDLYIRSLPTCDLQSDTDGEVKSPAPTLVINEFILQSDRPFMSFDLSSFNRKIKAFCPPFLLGKTCQMDGYF